jgi:SAM-dependent methyltransferase
MKPSKFHSNRKWHNWLIYDIGDKYLEKYSIYLKGHLVDLGCGEAPLKKYFLQFVDKYTGVDWSNTIHNSAADVISDLNIEIKLDDEVADSIISLSVMEHLCEPQVFLNESYRILKSGGNIILQVPWQWWIHEAPYDYYRYSPYGLKYMFKKAGFEDIEIEAQSGFFTTWIVKMNYFSTRFIRGPKPLRWLIKVILIPFWTIGQISAPYLDKLDSKWDAETQGFFVVARKK